MRTADRVARREFLRAAGGFAGLLACAADAAPAMAAAPESGSRSAPRDSAQLQRLLRAMEAQGRQFWSVPRQDGELLHVLVKVARARRVLEVGTSHGYSAIWLALALEETDGHLTTIEIDRMRHDLARRHVAQAGLTRRAHLVHGDAHAILPALDGPFDFVFLDADKEGQVNYFHELHPRKLAPGGLIAVHNAIRQASAMRDYLDLVRAHSEFDTVTLSATLDDGFCLSYRRRSA